MQILLEILVYVFVELLWAGLVSMFTRSSQPAAPVRSLPQVPRG